MKKALSLALLCSMAGNTFAFEASLDNLSFVGGKMDGAAALVGLCAASKWQKSNPSVTRKGPDASPVHTALEHCSAAVLMAALRNMTEGKNISPKDIAVKTAAGTAVDMAVDGLPTFDLGIVENTTAKQALLSYVVDWGMAQAGLN